MTSKYFVKELENANEMQPRRRRFVFTGTLLGLSPLSSVLGSSDVSKRTDKPIIPGASSTGIFPLRVEAGKRYLVDASNRPFLIQGDTAWSLIVRLSREQAEFYLDDRRKKNFNTILVNLIEHEFSDSPPKNYYGDNPFLIHGDFGVPNERYFAHVDYLIGKAAEKGILVMLAPAYMGFGGGSEGWYREMRVNGATKLRAYGRYLATRFRNRANILWVHGGDFNPPEKALLQALVGGIRDVDSRVLNTFHGARGTSATDFLGLEVPWLQVGTIYTDAFNVVTKAFQEYGRSQKPFFLIEARYEGDEGANELTVRLQAYQTVLSGGCGQVMGNGSIWQFGDGWQRALGSEGAYTLAYLRSLLEARAWTKLVPDTANTFLTSGVQQGAERAVAAVARDRSFGLIYMPSVRSVSLNLAQLTGPTVSAHWYDPTNGQLFVVFGSPFPASGMHEFLPAAQNARRQGDWVLLLESTK